MEITQPDSRSVLIQSGKGQSKSGEERLLSSINHLIEQLGLIAQSVNHTGKV